MRRVWDVLTPPSIANFATVCHTAGMSLESIINGALLSVMATLYRSGTYHTATRIEQPNGDVTESFTDTPVKVQRDVCSERMRQAAGYTERDVALIILAYGGVPTTDDEATDADGARWKIASVDRSADTSHWICRGTPS